MKYFLTGILSIIGSILFASDVLFDQLFLHDQQETHLAQVNLYLENPFVALPAREGGQTFISSGEDGILFQDLRGVECYAQPDCFAVCGEADTIPILLLTKSTTPIEDVLISLNFTEGLEYSSFAYVETGNAILDITNDGNPEAPVFSLDQISLDSGAVVLYIGVRAQCDIDVVNAPPSIAFSLDYTTPLGENCSDEITLDSYAGEVASADVRFQAGAPILANITQLGETPEGCIDVPLISLDPKAAAGGIRLLVDGYGFSDGIRLYGVLDATGNTIPDAATIDATTGLATIDVDGAALDTDGDGLFGVGDVGQSVQVCFAIDACPAETSYDINLSLGVSCDGESCGAIEQFSPATLTVSTAFGTGILTSFEVIQLFAFCNLAGEPEPYIFETTVSSNNATPIEGDLLDLIYRIDACPEAYLAVSRVYFVDDAGVELGTLPETSSLGTIYTQGSSGRLDVDLRRLDAATGDLDGAGGLDDLDGDGVFNDLPAGESVNMRVELTPSCDGIGGCTPMEDPPLVCDFTFQRWSGLRDCRTNRRNGNLTIPDDQIPLPADPSTGAFVGEDMFTFGGNLIAGYDFGQVGDVGGNTGVSSTRNASFTYNLGGPDFAECPNGGTIKLVVTISGNSDMIDDLEASNFVFDGTPLANTDITDASPLGLGTRVITINAGDVTTGQPFTYSFDVTFDEPGCGPPEILDVSALVVEDCDGCACDVTRACNVTTFLVDPEQDAGCNPSFGAAELTLCNLSVGYTDRSLATRLDFENPPVAADKTRVLPGDTVRLIGAYIVEDATGWNSINNFLSLQIRHTESSGSTGISRDNLTSRLDVDNARLQKLVLERLDGTSYDLGAISVPGGASTFDGDRGGITVAGGDPLSVHPGFSSPDYLPTGFNNAGNDFSDNGSFGVVFGRPAEFPGEPDALTALYNFIGGGFQDGDRILIEYDVPMISTPRFLVNGDLTPAIFLETGFFTPRAEGGNFDTDDNSRSTIGLTDDLTSAVYDFWEPGINLVSTLEYTDNCSAVMVQRFELDNVPDGWFDGQFKPFIGLEDLETSIPMPYAVTGDITYTHGGQAPVVVVPDSTRQLENVTYSGGTALLPVSNASGVLYFVDAEKTDGLRADDYVGWDQGDTDATLVGGTFPLLGVGLGTTEAVPDFLEFRIPLTRVCGTPTQAIGLLSSTYNASSRYLPDYRSGGLVCNNGAWFVGQTCQEAGVGNSFYWPYDRDSPGNPTHVANDEVVFTTEVGVIPTNYTAGGSNFGAPLFADAPGTEANTYTLSLDQDIPGGTLVVSSSLAIDLQTINAVAPTLLSTTANGNVYTVDLGALVAGDYMFEFVTDLLFCGPAQVCVEAILGCPTDPAGAAALAEIIAASGKSCGDNPVCFSYISGIADAFLDWEVPVPVTCGGTEPYSITLQNIGGSDMSNPVLTLFQPAGLSITNLMASLDGAGAIPFTLPTTGTVGVYGIPMSNTAGSLPVIPEGSSLVITFDGDVDCDFIYGTPLTAQLTADVACDRIYESLPVSSATLNVAPEPTAPSLKVEPSMTDISCSDGGGLIVITSVNTGKGATGPTAVCLNLPAGISITESDINVIAPEGFTIDDFVVAPLGDGQKVTFSGPENAEIGGIFCLEVNFTVGNLDCGVVDVGYEIKVDQEVACSPTSCGPIPMNIAENGVLRFNVVPDAGEVEGIVSASCSATPGNVMLNYAVDITNNGSDYDNQPVTIEAFFDADNDGVGDVSLGDMSLGSNTENLTLTSGQSTTLTGSFDIDESLACAIVLSIQSPGCTCSELFLPFSEVLPDFINDLGTNIAVCPGEAFVLEGACIDAEYALSPAAAGTIDTSVDGEVTIDFNEGFAGVAVELTVTTSLGSCAEQSAVITITELDELSFGPYDVALCSEGCQIVDLGIPLSLQEDITVSISPSTGITDPTSFEPAFCDPITPSVRTVAFSLQDGLCETEAELTISVVEAPSILLPGNLTQCKGGFNLSELTTITPVTLDGTWSTSGDGDFGSSTRYSEAETYTPGPSDIAGGEVTLTLRTDNPEGPCGVRRAKAEITILLVDCGSFFWDGSND